MVSGYGPIGLTISTSFGPTGIIEGSLRPARDHRMGYSIETDMPQQRLTR
jgi:hypothetical protein